MDTLLSVGFTEWAVKVTLAAPLLVPCFQITILLKQVDGALLLGALQKAVALAALFAPLFRSGSSDPCIRLLLSVGSARAVFRAFASALFSATSSILSC